MNINKARSFTCVIILSITAWGCSSKPPSVNSAQPTDRVTAQQIQDERLITDKRLANSVVLVGIAEGKNPMGLKKVEAELFNQTKYTQTFRYRFTWFDDAGLSLPSAMAVWKTKSVLSGQRIRITALAPSAKADDFQLEMIRGQ